MAHQRPLYTEPDELLRRIAPEPTPLTGLRTIPFGRDVEGFRDWLAGELIRERVPEAKSLDMLLAATENRDERRRARRCVEEVRVERRAGRFVCEIVDRGAGFDDPTAGYLAPRSGIGAGLWVARQLTWRIEFFQSPEGFTARILL